MDLVSLVLPPIRVSVLPLDLLVALTLIPAAIAVFVASANLALAVFLLLVAELAAKSG
jgi:hypothetical protein